MKVSMSMLKLKSLRNLLRVVACLSLGLAWHTCGPWQVCPVLCHSQNLACGNGVRSQWCDAPAAPFRQFTPDPFTTPIPKRNGDKALAGQDTFVSLTEPIVVAMIEPVTKPTTEPTTEPVSEPVTGLVPEQPAEAFARTARVDLPQFHVPGLEPEMARLQRLHAQHHPAAFSDCTLWDRWLPHATLWTGPEAVERYRRSLLQRRMDDEGYVSMQQHRGMAHSEGWPFPAWQQSTGMGFHFSILQEEWTVQNFRTVASVDTTGWELEGGEFLGIDPARGLRIRVTEPTLRLTTPAFQCGTIVAPFVRLELGVSEWPASAAARLRWQFAEETDWEPTRFWDLAPADTTGSLHYLNLPVHRHPQYAGMLQRYQIEVSGAVGSEWVLKSLITAIDTRHPITNANYLRACSDYVQWTQDQAFLAENLPRMRLALKYMIDEFSLQQQRHVWVPWVGHDGRSGIIYNAAGQKSLRPGLGVGNNYWDLLPFGGHDALATVYAYDALRRMAELEAALESGLLGSGNNAAALAEFSAADLNGLADSIRSDFQKRFWNPETGRFYGWIDVDGQAYDYGFTFVNLEAIYYGLASEEQAQSIFAWLDGTRLVAGDTSQGADIYHWRFAPRATTRRNIETYVWAWSAPESIAWGGQVQDGGAVLGFSYFDVMARLQQQGPDAAWARLQAILAWYGDIEAAGGYRSYYRDPARGTLQGGGTAGGLGLDFEFMESVLVPQVMLYGFLGFRPTETGYEVHPRLPAGWPSLTITNIHHGTQRLDITAHSDGRVVVETR